MIPISNRSAAERSTAMARFCLEKRTTQTAAMHTEAAYGHRQQNDRQLPEHGKGRNLPLAFAGHLPAAHHAAVKMFLFDHTAIGREGSRNCRQNSKYQQNHQKCHSHRLFFSVPEK